MELVKGGAFYFLRYELLPKSGGGGRGNGNEFENNASDHKLSC